MISDYNSLVKQRDAYLIKAGPNNSSLKSLERQLDNYLNNIIVSIDNYLKKLDVSINNISTKENEFQSFYKKVPENEKILRSIERELNIKEALFLLLLQKKEEASINLAVVKPSIKIIDNSLSSSVPVSPNSQYLILSFLILGLAIPAIFLYLWFLFDNKVHTKGQLESLINEKIPVIAEIPYIIEKSQLNILNSSLSRSPLAESVRMIIANLKFNFEFSFEKRKCCDVGNFVY